MKQNRFNHKLLKTTEKDTKKTTKKELHGVYLRFPKIVSLLCRLPYFIGEDIKHNTPIENLKSLSYIHYVQLPYTIQSIYALYENGYYLEGMILFRHLLEAFIQTKYFYKYPEKYIEHITRKKPIRFRMMFDEFSIGYYNKYYGNQYSEAAHGILYKSFFRFDQIGTNLQKPIIGCRYDEAKATLLMNIVIPIILGFILYFPKIFTLTTLLQDENEAKNYKQIVKWLREYMKMHNADFPKTEDYYVHINKIIM